MPEATEPLLVLNSIAPEYPRSLVEALRTAGYTAEARVIPPESSNVPNRRATRWLVLVAPDEVDEARADLLELGADPEYFDLSVPTYNWRPAALAVAIIVAVFALVLVLAAFTGKLGTG